MKKYYILGFLLLLTSTIGMFPSGVYAQTNDNDDDGVPNDVDQCLYLQEDYEGALDGCPSNFVPWYDEDYDGIEDHNDLCPNLKETYNRDRKSTRLNSSHT